MELLFNVTQSSGKLENTFYAECNGSSDLTVLNNMNDEESFNFNIFSRIAGKTVSWDFNILPSIKNVFPIKVVRTDDSILQISVDSYYKLMEEYLTNGTDYDTDYKVEIKLTQNDYNDGLQTIPSPNDPFIISLYFPKWTPTLKILTIPKQKTQ